MGLNVNFKTGLAIGAMSVFVLLGFASGASAEKINDFDATVRINSDSSIQVTEKINYDFGDIQKHGIYRDIDTQGKLNISNISVTDESGSPYQFQTSNNSDYVSVKIGDPNSTITGSHTYIIDYVVNNAIGYFDSFDELYWNVTGNRWLFSIDKTTATIILPVSISQDLARVACYEGVAGSTNYCSTKTYVADVDGKASTFTFSQYNLAVGEGLTIAVGFPKGIVPKPPLTFLERNPGIRYLVFLLPILVFIFMFRQWSKYGRDPKGTSIIVPQYDAPDELTPLAVAAVAHNKIRNSDISAEIIYLATKGFLKIEKITTKVLFFDSSDYIFRRTNDDFSSLTEADQKIMRGATPEAETKLSELTKVFYVLINDIRTKTYNLLITGGYIKHNPEKIIIKYFWTVLVIMLSVPVGLAVSLGLDNIGIFVLSVISGAISLVVVIIFAFLMPARTEKGVATREYILGLKEYLQIAEKERIAFHNAPEKRPEVFEKLLPYAMVLGVEKAWAKEFQDIYLTPPNWYNDPAGGSFNSVIFVANLGNFNTVATTSLEASPRSSGSGGGGFSGGGGGGGGGGSW